MDDVLTIPKSSNPAEFDVTKRNVLSKIATILDPLGFIGPVVARQKSSCKSYAAPEKAKREATKSKLEQTNQNSPIACQS